MTQPIGKRNILVRPGLENLQEHQVGIADVLNVMTVVGVDIADIAG
jgi:hypothetical protein